MPDEPLVSRAEMDRKLASLRELLEKDIKHEGDLRQLTERLGKEALDKAERFITEKSAAHNDLLTKMIARDKEYVTKEDMDKERASARDRMRLYVAAAGVVIVILNFVIRYFVPTPR
jgi:hypothetical protein